MSTQKNPIQLNLYKEEYHTTGNIHLSVWQASFLQHLMYSKLFISYHVKWEKLLMLLIFCQFNCFQNTQENW